MPFITTGVHFRGNYGTLKIEKNIERLYITIIILIITLKIINVLPIDWGAILLISIVAVFYIVGFIQYLIIKLITDFIDRKMAKKIGDL
ncbi:hypothetical protein AFERRID_04680 [Acidithiobacillus ferridurans]|uniref:Uncharacterized protein n=1 Tax=Acidithiobacillus ferridurans TaxID=1232575 RepID=A0A2Z6IF44_ACIFI|nr:hypothetical protein AFERRID_04680 [Acidithiobacillus ferridurans]